VCDEEERGRAFAPRAVLVDGDALRGLEKQEERHPTTWQRVCKTAAAQHVWRRRSCVSARQRRAVHDEWCDGGRKFDTPCSLSTILTYVSMGGDCMEEWLTHTREQKKNEEQAFQRETMTLTLSMRRPLSILVEFMR
jgi:hypothetical protein